MDISTRDCMDSKSKENKKDGSLDRAIEDLIKVIRNTPEYISFKQEKERINNDSECIEKIHRFRELTYDLQNASPEQRMRDEGRYMAEIDRLSTDGRVTDYMQAEVDFARLYQDVMEKILNNIELY
ncbi:MAG: YlbF family regulator [Lachnospiraceae bacterium]|nr:YlbF family regulator [Lachnospiraceae bacterium]